MRRILGIDPGSRITGFGIIELVQGQPRCVSGGCIRLKAQSMPERLKILFAEIHDIARTYQPTELAFEQVFVDKNVRSALMLGQARGVAIAAAMAESLPVFEYTPRQVKLAVVGRGGAEKGQVQHMIQVLLGLDKKPQADAADALAVALCHLHSFSSGSQGATSVRSRKRSTKWKTYDRTNSGQVD